MSGQAYDEVFSVAYEKGGWADKMTIILNIISIIIEIIQDN